MISPTSHCLVSEARNLFRSHPGGPQVRSSRARLGALMFSGSSGDSDTELSGTPHPSTPNGVEAEPGTEWEAPALSCHLPPETGIGLHPEGTAGLGGGVLRPWSLGLAPLWPAAHSPHRRRPL